MDKTILRDQLKEIADTVRELAGHEYLYFDTPLEAKLTPHTPPVNLWGVCVSAANDVYLLKWIQPEPGQNEEEWHQLEACDQNAQIVIPSLYQRIKLIKQQHETQSTSKRL